MDISDPTRSLLNSAKQGDRTALERLVSDYHAELEQHIRMRVGAHLRETVAPDDILQESLAQAIKSVEQCHADSGASFLRWLKGIAEHVILNSARRQRADRVLYVDHEARDEGPTPSRLLQRGERLQRLEDALQRLRPDHRRAVTLVRLEGMKVKEAAERMNRTPKAVSNLLSRALKELRDALGDTESLNLPPGHMLDRGNHGR